MLASSSGAQVAREELQALLPGGRGRRRLVRRAVVGVERVARVGINDHLHVRVAHPHHVDESRRGRRSAPWRRPPAAPRRRASRRRCPLSRPARSPGLPYPCAPPWRGWERRPARSRRGRRLPPATGGGSSDPPLPSCNPLDLRATTRGFVAETRAGRMIL